MRIKNRIYWSFFILASVFVINGIITIVTLNYNQKLSKHISEVADPSVQALHEFRKMLLQSEMYSTNWVFIRASENDKDALKRLHASSYPEIKKQLSSLSANWYNHAMIDTLQTMFNSFNQLLVNEKKIMHTLVKFEDYDDPSKRFAAEELIENEVLPHTTSLMNSLVRLLSKEQDSRILEEKELENSSMLLRILISILAVIIIALAVFLSAYMTKRIINPINTIRFMINDLGKGITKRVEYKANGDEIGEMVTSVNNLSEKLLVSASFAHEIGKRNFNIAFKPLSGQDALGKALITMCDNLKSTDEKLNEAQHIAHLGSWEIDMINNTNSWSDEVYKIYGINKGDLPPTKESFLSFMHPDDLDFANKSIASAFSTLTDSSFNFRFIKKDGSARHGYTEWKFGFDESGVPIRLYGITMDITERKESEISLLESEEQIKTIYDAVLDAVIIIDAEGKIVKWDSKSEALFGWKEEEMIGALLSEKIIPHQHREAHERGMKHFLKTGVGPVLGKTIEVRALNKSNMEFDISLSISPSLVKDKYQFIGFVRDITPRKEAEATLKKNNEELKKTNRELDKFVYSVSHDLRAPLLSMLGIVEISEEETTDAFILEHLGFLKGSITKLDGFIKDILEYSRNARTEVKNEEINFKEMLTDITDNLKYMGGTTVRKVDIKYEIKNQKPFLSDKSRISIVLNNLISNAIRYRDPSADNPFVDVQIDMSDTETGIMVKDNGIGISKENQKKIFDMFYRVSENSVGSGLGLYLVKEIIEKLNGQIKVESEIGKGTSFRVYLPN